MLAVVIRRILQSLLVLVVVSVVAFLLFRFVGDPVNNMVGADTTADIRAAIRARLGLDELIWVQFLRFAGSVLTGDFGLSLRNSQPVARLIAERLPATLELAVAAALIALLLGIPAGVFTALRPRSIASRLLLGISLFGISLPTFVTGIPLVYVFGVRLGVLPTFGRGDTNDIGWWSTGLLTASGLRSLILPAFTLGLFQLTLIMRLVRAEMLGILRSDFIRFARARGLPDRLIHFRHALRSALVPVITVAGLQFGALIAFSIVTESVFQWPGLGLLFIQAVQFADVPVMAAYLLLVALIFVAVNLMVDVLYLRVDPRLRIEGSLRSGAAA
jgi:peptide/nickel transport system permease protein